MTRDELLAVYDAPYAATYDGRFLHGENYEEATAFELQWLREHMPPGARWLDVACGTGWFLAQFPDRERCGLDLSPAMLAQARRANPNVTLVEGDFREPHPQLARRWDFVTLMWWAYCYASNVGEVRRTIANLASWTAPGGACFFPIFDPDELCQVAIPNQLGGTEVTALLWNWTDDRCGKVHRELIAPLRDVLLRFFREEFEEVDVIDYPRFRIDAVGGTRRAIWARRPLECGGLPPL